MRLEIYAISLTAVILVMLAYVLFGCVFLFRKKPPKTEEAKRAPAATFGIVLQSVSFVLAWNPPRMRWWPFPPSHAGEIVLAATTVILAYASCWFSIRAVQTLGKQWTYADRVIKGHELVTQGPYRVARNPIYLGMFGLILLSCLAFSRWWSALAAVALFLIGNHVAHWNGARPDSGSPCSMRQATVFDRSSLLLRLCHRRRWATISTCWVGTRLFLWQAPRFRAERLRREGGNVFHSVQISQLLPRARRPRIIDTHVG